MDPLGFALEHFDAIGGWRSHEEGHAIDAHGELPDGRSFRGGAELALLLRSDPRFVRSIAAKAASKP